MRIVKRIPMFIYTILLSSIILFFFLFLIKTIPMEPQTAPGGTSGYPAPQTQQPIDKNFIATSYPIAITVTPIKETAITTPSPLKPTVSTNSEKLGQMSNTIQKTEMARDLSLKQLPLETKSTPVSPYSVAFTSVEDFPNLVYNDPFLSLNGYDFSPCIQSKKPGIAVFVKSLRKIPDYYILPFYNSDNNLCGAAIINIENGRAFTGTWSSKKGDKFPSVSAEDAISLVSAQTGRKVVGIPTLVFGYFRENSNPFNPIWQVDTTDGQTYFVIFITGIDEDQKITTTVTIMNSNNIHNLE